MKVFKIDGAKNSFALVSFLGMQTSSLENSLQKDKAKLVRLASEISNHKLLGVDGCVFIFPDSSLDFKWDFYNSDGSDALMCGNAARAVAFWYYKCVSPKMHIRYATAAQIVDAEILNPKDAKSSEHTEESKLQEGWVKVYLKPSRFIGNADVNDDGTQADKSIKAAVYDSGVPHLCLYVPILPDEILNFEGIGKLFFEKAKSLRFPKILDHKGANVTLVWRDEEKSGLSGKNSIQAMSFERGVENWTQACGTGAIAAAHFAKDNLELHFPINVQMPGGVLEVDEMDERMTLTGPAKILKVIDLDLKF